jgi:hypothetical protein
MRHHQHPAKLFLATPILLPTLLPTWRDEVAENKIAFFMLQMFMFIMLLTPIGNLSASSIGSGGIAYFMLLLCMAFPTILLNPEGKPLRERLPAYALDATLVVHAYFYMMTLLLLLLNLCYSFVGIDQNLRFTLNGLLSVGVATMVGVQMLESYSTKAGPKVVVAAIIGSMVVTYYAGHYFAGVAAKHL